MDSSSPNVSVGFRWGMDGTGTQVNPKETDNSVHQGVPLVACGAPNYLGKTQYRLLRLKDVHLAPQIIHVTSGLNSQPAFGPTDVGAG